MKKIDYELLKVMMYVLNNDTREGGYLFGEEQLLGKNLHYDEEDDLDFDFDFDYLYCSADYAFVA